MVRFLDANAPCEGFEELLHTQLPEPAVCPASWPHAAPTPAPRLSLTTHSMWAARRVCLNAAAAAGCAGLKGEARAEEERAPAGGRIGELGERLPSNEVSFQFIRLTATT